MKERWKPISGYEGLYEVSSLGNFRQLRVLQLSKYANGYSRVYLNKDGVVMSFNAHRIIASTFIPNPENKPCVNHIDLVRTNNNVKNLEWVTHKENTAHANKHGKISKGERHYMSKLNDKQVKKIRREYLLLLKRGVPMYGLKTRLAEKYNTPQSTVKNIVLGINRKSYTKRK